MVRLGAMHVRVGAVLGISAIVAAGLGIAPLLEEASAAPNPSPRASVSGFSYVVTQSVPVGIYPRYVVYKDNPGSVDDSLYVTVGGSPKNVAVIGFSDTDPSLSVDDSIPLPVTVDPYGLAIGYDDTVYVALDASGLFPKYVGAINARTNTLDDSVLLPPVTGIEVVPQNLAVLGDDTVGDDTIYVQGTNLASIVRARPLQLATSLAYPGAATGGGVVLTADDTAYFSTTNNLRAMRDGTWIGGGVSLGLMPRVPAITPDDTIYVPNSGDNSLSVVNGRTQSVTTLSPGGSALQSPTLAAYDPVYKRLYVSNSQGFPGSVTVFNTLTNTVDDTIAVGDGPIGIAVSPDGSRVFVVNYQSGTVSVVTVTPSSPTPPTPVPTPVYPPGAPTQVKAVAGDAFAEVSWTAPSDSGSYPVTDYEVTSTPGDHTCLVKAPALTCQVTGLTNGTAYTFTARALNGAGWGAYSSPSNSVTPKAPPKPTIMITGSRDSADTRYVKVSGTTTDLVGKQVTPWVRFPGQSAFSAGTGVRTVNANGSFAWQRKTGKKIYVYFQHEDVKSNTVTISAR